MHSSAILALALLAAVVGVVQGSFTGGVATWYGAPKAPSCLSSFVYPGFKSIAMNMAQYGNGAACGACVYACFTPPEWWVMQNGRVPGGKVCMNAVVTNLCPGCWYNSFDIGTTGNGRWPLTWDYVPCPAAKANFRVIAGNPWYAKVKAEGMGAIRSVTCNGRPFKATFDGSWTSTGLGGGATFDKGVTCTFVPQFGQPQMHTYAGYLFKR